MTADMKGSVQRGEQESTIPEVFASGRRRLREKIQEFLLVVLIVIMYPAIITASFAVDYFPDYDMVIIALFVGMLLITLGILGWSDPE